MRMNFGSKQDSLKHERKCHIHSAKRERWICNPLWESNSNDRQMRNVYVWKVGHASLNNWEIKMKLIAIQNKIIDISDGEITTGCHHDGKA
mmetsp:Transcript_28707/g.80920  ORF Transcript_28707/g.80920 Transcript_28707/m.80920 type:complete len:91 (-) Transcript_28707:8-280(-)